MGEQLGENDEVEKVIRADMAKADQEARQHRLSNSKRRIERAKEFVGDLVPLNDAAIERIAAILGVGDIRTTEERQQDNKRRRRIMKNEVNTLKLRVQEQTGTIKQQLLQYSRELDNLWRKMSGIQINSAERGQYEDIRYQYDKVARLRDAVLENQTKVSQRAFRMEYLGRIQEAVEIYEQLILDECLVPEVYESLGKIHLDNQRYDDALMVCERFIAVLSPSADSKWYVRRENLTRRLAAYGHTRKEL